MWTSTSIALGFLIATAHAGSLSAQISADPSAVRALRGARSLKCSFPWYASTDWDQDEPRVKSDGTQEDFGFQIDGIDYRNERARIIGNAGADDLGATTGEHSVSFVEIVPTGSVNLTTVYAWRDKSGRFKAVHSRHTAIGGPSPSQNYGYCQIW
jgi:hypothetical protein